MIRLDVFDVSCGVHQTIGRVRWDGHNATEIVHKEAIGMPIASIMPGLESLTCLPEVDLYVLDEVGDLAGAVEVGINSADHKSHINIDNSLMLTVHLEHK